MKDTKVTMPVIALRGLTILPQMLIHFDISRERSILAVEQAMVKDQKIFLVTQKSISEENPKLNDLYSVGTIANIKQLVRLQGSMMRVLVEGVQKGSLEEFISEEPILIGQILIPEEEDMQFDSLTEEAYIRILKEKVERFGSFNPKWMKEAAAPILERDNLKEMLSQISIHLPFDYEKKQRILEAEGLEKNFIEICEILDDETKVTQIKRDLQEKVRERIDKNQREYVLREQLKVIREELGEDTTGSDAEKFLEKLGGLDASKEVKDQIQKEIERFRGMSPGIQEAGVLRSYIETLLGYPWNTVSEDNLNFSSVKEVLDKEHYGLKSVKDRILEFLAVRALTKKGGSPMICLVGPPGTGKSSIAKSVARALDKEYVRISLGGVRDEAEIRGHRKTYVGAMPGRIVAAIKQAGVKNPVLLLDEIDKVSSDHKGDTASALLEVLDSDQNQSFRDHYMELPVDLSEVLFIATANTVQTISPPLLDRMEVIEINSYTENEKYHIAKDYLIQKQKKINGIEEQQLTLSPKALEKIIHNYTREAGVRDLERKIGMICRKAAREILEQRKSRIRVTESSLNRYLGKEKVSYEKANSRDEVGIVRGLAWTSAGGDTLSIEVNVMPGKGILSLTGKLGDVMKESAQTALSYVRSVSSSYGVKPVFFEKNDIHIHVPEGAVPKDGPSAGITIATAILSAVSGRKVYAKVAMTGEITLRGRVLPVGGLKEKILAARQAGIEKVLVPFQNSPDIAELEDEITRGMEIIGVSQMPEVIEHAFQRE